MENYIFIIFISAVIFGFVGIIIAKNKNISSTSGFLWGFLLGPLGCIILALLNNDNHKPNNNDTQTTHQNNTENFPDYKRDLSLDRYKLYLQSKYNIVKNDTFGKFVFDDKMFETIENALLAAHEFDVEKHKIAWNKYKQWHEERGIPLQ